MSFEVAIPLFSLISLPYTLIPYKRAIKKKLWWTYAFSAHSMAVCIIVALFSLFAMKYNVLNIIAGTLLAVSGLGSQILGLVYIISDKKFT